jgi:hypothetical protein
LVDQLSANTDGTILACPNCGSSYITPGVKTTNIFVGADAGNLSAQNEK